MSSTARFPQEVAASRTLFAAGMFCLLVVFGACGSGAPQPNTAAGSRRAAANGAPPFVLGVGDVVRVSVYKSPELDVTVPVRPDGRISVPLLGEEQAAGLTVEQLRQNLTEGYRQYVTAPVVSVSLQEVNSQKIFVSGEVNNPGQFDLKQETRLMQALAMAGGLTPYAKKDRVVILRTTGGRQTRIKVDLKAIISGDRPSDNIVLQPGDTIFVP